MPPRLRGDAELTATPPTAVCVGWNPELRHLISPTRCDLTPVPCHHYAASTRRSQSRSPSSRVRCIIYER